MKLAPVLAFLFTLLAFVSTFFHTSETSGGFIDNEYGLNYQTISYVSAYGAAFSGYFLVCREDVRLFATSYTKLLSLIMMFFMYLNFVIILFAGGRGGFIAFGVQVLLFFIVRFKYMTTNQKVFTAFGAIVLLFLIVPITISFVEHSTFEGSGFGRILDFIYKNEQSGRENIRALAINSFLEKPILGHGIGSVFYEIGHYSHNSLLDVMVETGMIGLFVYVAILYMAFARMVRCVRHNRKEYLWLILFLGSLSMSLSSGYYLAQLPLWWSIAFIFTRQHQSA